MNSRYLIQAYPSKPDHTVSVIGGKALQLRKIDPVLVPDWVVVTSDCPDDRLPDICNKAWHSIGPSNLDSVQYKFIKESTYAVRSSAIEEDGENQSFAGIFESKLNVPISGIEHAVREVRDSALAERVLTYQEARDLSTLSVPAVIIMNMVDAKYSGVLFTKEPVEGTDRMMLEYEEGAGGVVDGTGDSNMLFLDPKNFVTPELNRDDYLASPFFGQTSLHTIWTEAKRLANNYGRPVDIEWAIDQDDKPWILQVRPITAGVTA